MVFTINFHGGHRMETIKKNIHKLIDSIDNIKALKNIEKLIKQYITFYLSHK